MRAYRTVVLLALVASALVPTRPAAGAFPGTNGVIAYTAFRGTQADICVVNADGSDPRILVGGPADQADPAWSADGSKLAFVEHDATGIPHIKVFDLRTQMTADLGPGFQPAWSPDGSRIAYVDAGLWVMDADGTQRSPITLPPTEYSDPSDPAWSPDGSKIVFYDDIRDGAVDEGGIWVTTPTGGDPIRIGDGGPASWSPDGSRLVNDGGFWQMVISVMNADGSDPLFIVENERLGQSVSGSTWSPDGSKIAFSRGDEIRDRYEVDLWTVAPDGTGAAPLFQSSVAEFSPEWQPVTASTPTAPAGDPCTYDLIERTLTLDLRRHLIARGRVAAADGSEPCVRAWVRVSRRTSQGWRQLDQVLTNDTGVYRVKLPDKPGRYRAAALGDARCAAARSVGRVHRH